MRRRHSRARFHEPSLVPLADMLTNTVGVIVFILIFTVLTAGGVVMVKRLPLEHSTSAEPLHFVCKGGRLMPLDVEALTEDFMEPFSKPKSYYELDRWVEKFNERQVENEYFVVTGDGKVHKIDLGFYKSGWLSLALVVNAREGVGETAQELKRPDSRLREILKSHDASGKFAHFLTYPDSIDVFVSARSVAVEAMGYSTGWTPAKEGEPIRFSAGGRAATEQ